ncbi:hypothetical protein J5N97_022231 [Dioscorea zingiberensis]|uniref:SEC7 domain-containing protein n=1 Tax=Dioscorea zingiberensis TaxID=325984 RepID=A0A9D5CAK2_9LILI|nr:hypothetical protein J5N97_022231 [Dioscorea zingiberensis]
MLTGAVQISGKELARTEKGKGKTTASARPRRPGDSPAPNQSGSHRCRSLTGVEAGSTLVAGASGQAAPLSVSPDGIWRRRSWAAGKKAMIGEYLGQHEEFPPAVMHAYVDSMKFTGLKFDAAVREFLKGFRLPGEA